MGIFNISIVNKTFESHNERDCPNVADARAEAIRGALEIGTGEVDDSNPLFGAEISIGQGGKRLERFVLTIAVSPLNS